MSVLSVAFSFLGLALVVFVGVLLVWCLIAGLFHGARIVANYFWWIGSALFWVAVAALLFYFLFM